MRGINSLENACKMKDLDLTWMHASRLLSKLPSAKFSVNQTIARRRRNKSEVKRENLSGVKMMVAVAGGRKRRVQGVNHTEISPLHTR